MAYYLIGPTDRGDEWTCSREDRHESGRIVTVICQTSAADTSITARKEDGYASSAELSEHAAGTVQDVSVSGRLMDAGRLTYWHKILERSARLPRMKY